MTATTSDPAKVEHLTTLFERLGLRRGNAEAWAEDLLATGEVDVILPPKPPGGDDFATRSDKETMKIIDPIRQIQAIRPGDKVIVRLDRNRAPDSMEGAEAYHGLLSRWAPEVEWLLVDCEQVEVVRDGE